MNNYLLRGIWPTLALLSLGVVAAGCSSSRVTEDSLARAGQTLTADTTRVFGFESAADWSTTSGAPVRSNQHDQGDSALQLTSTGSTSITSVKVSGPIIATSTLAVDIIVPHLQSPLWFGQAQIVLNAPSIGLFNEWVGATAFPFPYAIFQRVQFPVSDAVVQKLSGSFTDLQATITVTGGAGTYILDNLRFISSTEAASPVAPMKIGPIMDFEDPNLWVATQPALATSSDIRIRGAHSLAVSNFTFTRVQSALLSSPIGVQPFITFDFRIPSPQVNQWWRGSLDLVASIPSKGLSNVIVGQRDLLSFPEGVLTKIVFPLPSNLLAALSGTYNDLTFALILNVPSEQAGSYLLDYLRFQPDAIGDPEPPEVTGSGTPAVTVTAPPLDIPPLGGTGNAAAQSATTFVNWAAGARASQVVQARQVIRGAANNVDVIKALINEVSLDNQLQLDRSLVALSVLGEMQSPIAQDFYLSVLSLPLPQDLPGVINQPAMFLAMLQTKIVDCLAFMRSDQGNAVLLQLISQHPSATVRVEAIRAYLDNNGSGARADVLAVVRSSEAIVLEGFPHVSETDRNYVFDDQMDSYLAKHPVGDPNAGK